MLPLTYLPCLIFHFVLSLHMHLNVKLTSSLRLCFFLQHMGDFNYPRLADFGAAISGANKLLCQEVLEELDVRVLLEAPFTYLHFIITLPCYVIDVWNAQLGCLCTAITNIFVPIRNQEHSCIHGAHSHLQDFGPLVHMHARNVLEMKRDCLNFIFNAPEFAMYLFTVCTIALSFLVPHTFRETL